MIQSLALNRREFRELFEEEINEYGELLLYKSVRCFSKREVVSHFFKLTDQILSCLEMKGIMPEECKLLKDQEKGTGKVVPVLN
jgi:hypothetical protein